MAGISVCPREEVPALRSRTEIASVFLSHLSSESITDCNCTDWLLRAWIRRFLRVHGRATCAVSLWGGCPVVPESAVREAPGLSAQVGGEAWWLCPGLFRSPGWCSLRDSDRSNHKGVTFSGKAPDLDYSEIKYKKLGICFS